VDSVFVKANASMDSLVEKDILDDADHYSEELKKEERIWRKLKIRIQSFSCPYLFVGKHTTLIQVDEGDVLIGLMTFTGKTGEGFNYRSEFQGIGGTTLNIANIAELLWCNETLEAYGIQTCSDYPATDFTRFWPINIQTGATNPTMAWTPVNAVTDCNQHTIIGDNSSTQGDVDIYYRNPSRHRFDFSEMLVVTNPILLWLFKHGWEDPGWGRDDASQISILSAVHALADQISDTELRAQVKKLSSKGIAKVANRMAGTR